LGLEVGRPALAGSIGFTARGNDQSVVDNWTLVTLRRRALPLIFN
jgi:hypothetical protein